MVVCEVLCCVVSHLQSGSKFDRELKEKNDSREGRDRNKQEGEKKGKPQRERKWGKEEEEQGKTTQTTQGKHTSTRHTDMKLTSSSRHQKRTNFEQTRNSMKIATIDTWSDLMVLLVVVWGP